MFESIIWFVMKDSRVKLQLIKANSTVFLIIYNLINLFLSLLILVYKEEYEYLPKNLKDFLMIKVYLELLQGILFMPFLIYKSFLKYNFNPKKPEEKYRIDLYLRSRILERALGITFPGLFMLFFGFFNMIWSMIFVNRLYEFNEGFENYFVYGFIFVDILAFVITFIFGVFVLFFKIKGAYKGFVDNKRVLKRKIILE